MQGRDATVETAWNAFGFIDVLINNAGIQVAIPSGDRGNFFDAHCYIVLYTYYGKRKEEYFLCNWLEEMTPPTHPCAGARGEGPPIAPSKWRWRCGNRLCDMYFYSPEGKMYRSRKELNAYLSTLHGGPSPAEFYWNVTKDDLKNACYNDNYFTHATTTNNSETGNVRTCFLVAASNLYVFKDVLNDGNSAFHAVSQTRLILEMDATQLRKRTWAYTRTEGSHIAHLTFQFYKPLDACGTNLDQYLENMQSDGQPAGIFELIMIAFMNNINIVIIDQSQQQPTTDVYRDMRNRFPLLMDDRPQWSKTIYLLHHVYGKPTMQCTGSNHFGILFPTTELEYQAHSGNPEKLVSSILSRNSNTTERQLKRNQDKTVVPHDACFLHLGGLLYLFKDVPADGNCLFHAVSGSKLIPTIQSSKLRLETCKFASKEGRQIAETTFNHFASFDSKDSNLDKYLERMSSDTEYAGTFELIMLAYMYSMNIIVVTQTNTPNNTDVYRDMNTFFPHLVSEVCWKRSLHLLHHVAGRPGVPLPKGNHFGILFPVTESQHKENSSNPEKLVCNLIRRNYLNTYHSMVRRTCSTQRTHEELVENKKRIHLKRKDPHKRYEENVLKEKRRHTSDKEPTKRRYIQNPEEEDATKKNQATTSTASKQTNDLLNTLTEAQLTDQQQDFLLEPTADTHFSYILNRYGKLMGEEYLPTVLCAVCACKHTPGKTERLHLDEIPNVHLLNAAAKHKTLDISGRFVLSNEAIFKASTSIPILSKKHEKGKVTTFDVDICAKCKKELGEGEVPKRSLASFDTGPVPKDLQSIRLTFAERMLVSCNFTSFQIFKIQSEGKSHLPQSTKPRVSKGHSISFKHASTRGTIEKYILPHDPQTLPRLMITCYIGPASSIEEAREMVRNTNQLTVRTAIIHQFARVYAELNPSRISHDPLRYSDHVSGTVPDVVFEMIDFDALVEDPTLDTPTFVDLDDAMHDDYAKRDQLRPDEQPDPNVQVIQRSGMVLPHLLSNGMEELKDTSLRNLNSSLLAIPTSKKPVSDYDTHYFVNTYPNIFLHGVGERPQNVSLPMYLKTLLRRPSTGAATDYSFPFEARNILLRHRTLHRVRLSLTLEHSSLIPNITDEDLANALHAIRNKEPINDRVRALLKQLQVTGADLRGTPQRLNRYRQQMLAGLFPLFGPFDVWITLNMQESSSQVLLRIAGEQDMPISYDVPEDVPNITKRMQICAENPAAVADFFHVFMRAFLDALLGLPYGVNDLSPIHKGVFGWTRAYMFVLEVSGKGTGPHAHGVLKVQGLNRDKLVERFNDPTLTDLYKRYLLTTFSQNLPNQEFDIEPPVLPGKQNDMIRSRRADEAKYRLVNPTMLKRNKHYMSIYPAHHLPTAFTDKKEWQETETYLAKRLIHIIRESGIHEHTATCKKNSHAGDDSDCRMSYPQPVFEEIAIYLDEHIDKESRQVTINGIDVIFPRDHAFVVAMNKWITLALGSNTAVYYMASGRQGRTRALYVTDYATKKPLSTYECITLFRASLQARRKQQAADDVQRVDVQKAALSTAVIVNRCLNALTGEIIVTGYECCADIAELPDHYASNSFIPLSAWSYMYSMLGRESRRTFNVIAQQDEEKNMSKATLTSPIQDYVYLDIPDSEKMTAYEFTAFYERVSKTRDKGGAKVLNNANSKETPLKDGVESEVNNATEEEPQDTDDYVPTVGRPMHKRIGFTATHKLSATHHVHRLAKMRVPFQVGRQYPSLPRNIEEAPEQSEVYAQYMLSIFRPWSPTMNNRCNENQTWWTTLKKYLETCPPWIPTIIKNMHIALDRDDTTKRATNSMDRISTNTMNHADSNFRYVDDDKPVKLSSAELLRVLEMDMMNTGENLSRPTHTSEQEFLRKGMDVLASRYKINSDQFQDQATWASKPSISCILDRESSSTEISQRVKSWQNALKELVRCNDEGVDYDMNNNKARRNCEERARDNDPFLQNVQTLLTDPMLLPIPDPGSDPKFKETKHRPSWERLNKPPTIKETLLAWHLTKKQAEFVIMVLVHFHETTAAKNTKQLLALCLGAPGTGKSQAMLAILWHMSQHSTTKGMHEEVATCAFTGGAAMLISTPHTTPMTTHRQFQITLKGPNRSSRSVNILTVRLGRLRYVFIDEFSFLSYRHLRDIAEQVAVGLGERAENERPFAGLNFVFFGDYEQLSMPGGHPMYHGAAAEESRDPEDMRTWYATEMERHTKHSSHDPSHAFMGRALWTSIDTIRTLTVQKRQAETPAGRRLQARCQALRDENFPDDFFDSLQAKAVTPAQLGSEEWSRPIYIVMRHSLRIPVDFQEARFQARLQSKRFFLWRTVDTVQGRKLPDKMQLVVDNMIIKKVARLQYFYEGMQIAFLDNKYFAAGNATNNIGHAISIALDTREPPDDFSKPARELKYLPLYVLVHVPNAQIDQLAPDLPPKVIPITPTSQSKNVRLGDNRHNLLEGKSISHVSVSRLGMRWTGIHAVTQYFSQGMSLLGRKCIVDLRIPVGGSPKNFAESILVMLSRHNDDDDWALLHPLWTPGSELERILVINNMRKLLCRDPDLHAELRRVRSIEDNITGPALKDILERHHDLGECLQDLI